MRHLARILCAIDLEKASGPAFDRALRLAVIGDAKLFLLHATPANVRFSSRARERLEYLTHLRKRAEAAGVKVRVEEQHGDPAGVIVLQCKLQESRFSRSGIQPTTRVAAVQRGIGFRARFASCRVAGSHRSLGCSGWDPGEETCQDLLAETRRMNSRDTNAMTRRFRNASSAASAPSRPSRIPARPPPLRARS